MRVNHLNLSFGLEKIFEDVSILLPENKKVGIVGDNGAGKTTFFRILIKELEPDSGTITWEQKRRISYLPQVITDAAFSKEENVFDYLLAGRPIDELKKRISSLYEEMLEQEEKEQAKTLKRVDVFQTQLDYFEPYEAESILLKIIDGMQIDDTILSKKLCELSGGQKSKIAFARLLYSKPDIILLDEPTNHLDQETKDFVLSYLKQYDGCIYVISHDKVFLNSLVDEILYIDKTHQKMRLFSGNYDQFLHILEEEKRRNEKVYEKQQKEKEKLDEIIARYIHGNEKKAKIAKDRIKKLERLKKEMVSLEKTPKIANVRFETRQESTRFPIRVEDLFFKYDESSKRNLFYKLSFEIERGEKFLIVGPNGSGKSTLLKLLVGILQPNRGEILYGVRTEIGYYAQEHEGLDLSKTVFENLDEYPLTEREKKGVLGRFLFTEEDLIKKVSVLSPGERARLALAKLSLTKANVLLLDEPTNHLDLVTQQKMAENLKYFDGTILFVTHNLEFVRNFEIGRILVLPEGKIYYYDEEIVKKYYELEQQEQKKKHS